MTKNEKKYVSSVIRGLARNGGKVDLAELNAILSRTTANHITVRELDSIPVVDGTAEKQIFVHEELTDTPEMMRIRELLNENDRRELTPGLLFALNALGDLGKHKVKRRTKFSSLHFLHGSRFATPPAPQAVPKPL